MSLSPEIHTFLGVPHVIRSRQMLELLALAQRVAQTNAAVLITGESGSGKEVIARSLHHYSLRSSRPWIDISCAALPDHLMESELFGYEKGAFSGADSLKLGLFELADRGTMFLDEIGELDMKMQVKLLRVLDNVPYYRLGGTRKVSVDVRVLAATNQDLEAAIEARAFRGDLFHRLCQVHLRVPPLRQRIEDIGPLAEFFLQQHGAGLSPEAIRVLEKHHWPGNVRELRNVVTRAAVFTGSSVISAEDIVAAGISPRGEIRVMTALPADDMGKDLWAMEKNLILSTLRETGGHQQKAASQLGISRKTLSRKLKLYGANTVSTLAEETL